MPRPQRVNLKGVTQSFLAKLRDKPEVTGAAVSGYRSGNAMAAMKFVTCETFSEGFGYEWSGPSP